MSPPNGAAVSTTSPTTGISATACGDTADDVLDDVGHDVGDVTDEITNVIEPSHWSSSSTVDRGATVEPCCDRKEVARRRTGSIPGFPAGPTG